MCSLLTGGLLPWQTVTTRLVHVTGRGFRARRRSPDRCRRTLLEVSTVGRAFRTRPGPPPAVPSLPLLLRNIWPSWHLGWVKIACHLLSGHPATVADGEQPGQPGDCRMASCALAKGRISSWRSQRAEGSRLVRRAGADERLRTGPGKSQAGGLPGVT